MVRTKGKRVHADLYLDPEKHEQLQKLSGLSRIPMAAYLREAVDDLLEKHGPKPNPRGIANVGPSIGQALSPTELTAIALAVQAALKPGIDIADRESLKRGFAKLRTASNWQVLNRKSQK